MFCKWKLEAALSTPYVDTADVSAAEAYEAGDAEVSTPGTTTNSDDQDVTVSHLAEAEHAFSEASTNLTSPESLQSPAEEMADTANTENSSVDDPDLPSSSVSASGNAARQSQAQRVGVDIVVVPAEEVVVEPIVEATAADHKPNDPLLERERASSTSGEDLVGSVVYMEQEADNSCVLHVEDPDSVSNGSGVYDNVHNLC